MNDQMKSIKNRFQKQPVYILLGILILLVILLIVLNGLGFFQSIEAKRKNYLEKTGRDFYENYYYPQLDELTTNMADFLSNFEDNGPSISANVMIERSFKTRKEVEKKLENCDLEKTKIMIYPKDPYGIEDYKFEIKLYCEE